MTNDLFDVSRLEECRMPVKKAVCDLTQIARDVRSVMGAIGSPSDQSTSTAWGPWK